MPRRQLFPITARHQRTCPASSADVISGMFPSDQVFIRVCHVKKGYEDRERHIREEFSKRGVPVNFFLDWDVADVTEEAKASFTASNRLRASEISLGLKHIGVWREFLKTDLPYCLVFEDDVFLAKNFVRKLNECLAEIGNPDRRAAVYLGNGCNYYVAGWKLRRGQQLYPASHARCADSYLITRPVAEARLAWIDKHKVSLPIDHQIEFIDEQLGIEMLWFERPIVEQGSQNGAFQSSVAGRRHLLRFKQIDWFLVKHWRRFFGHSSRRKQQAKSGEVLRLAPETGKIGGAKLSGEK